MPSGGKYLVNGSKARQADVHALFQSVQLNINNPNFLIMQGKITKVPLFPLSPSDLPVLSAIQSSFTLRSLPPSSPLSPSRFLTSFLFTLIITDTRPRRS
jgi:hypothetical protein